MLIGNLLLFSPILYMVLGLFTVLILKMFNVDSLICVRIMRFIVFLSVAIIYLTNNYIDDFIIANPEIYQIAIIVLSLIYGFLFLIYLLAYFKFL